MMTIPLILIVILSVLSVFFTNSNQTVVEVIAFGYKLKSSIGFLMVGALGIGVLLGILSMLPSVLKRSFTLLKQGEELAQMKQKDSAKKPETK